MAGYSKTPLPQKLGIKPNSRVALLHAPSELEHTLRAGVPEASFRTQVHGKNPFDVILLFVESQKDLQLEIKRVSPQLSLAGGLWIAWPKKASGIATDLDEGVVRQIGLATGLVDNKVCAVDETWSGLRFVIRLKDRPK
jgi:hypothetical protein